MRKALLPLIIIIATSLLLIRIFYLQVVNDTFKLQSENNAIKIKYDYPERGYIYDRYGKLVKELSPNSIGWDGTFNGQELPASDYWYVFKMDATAPEKRGHFSLKR